VGVFLEKVGTEWIKKCFKIITKTRSFLTTTTFLQPTKIFIELIHPGNTFHELLSPQISQAFLKLSYWYM